MTRPLGVAVIGAGMAGKAHAAAYRTAPALYDSLLPPVRLVSIADVNEPLEDVSLLLSAGLVGGLRRTHR